MIKTDTLPQFLRNKVAENDAFGLVEGLCQLLRSSPTEKISPTLHLFKFILKNDKELGCSISKLLCGWLCSLRLLKILMIYVICSIYCLAIKMMRVGLLPFP